eukprot:2495851-Pyramimonas_sp.AAC.1
MRVLPRPPQSSSFSSSSSSSSTLGLLLPHPLPPPSPPFHALRVLALLRLFFQSAKVVGQFAKDHEETEGARKKNLIWQFVPQDGDAIKLSWVNHRDRPRMLRAAQGGQITQLTGFKGQGVPESDGEKAAVKFMIEELTKYGKGVLTKPQLEQSKRKWLVENGIDRDTCPKG